MPKSIFNICFTGTGAGIAGAWVPKAHDPYKYIQVDLRKRCEVSGVITQGRNDYDHWVTTFQVNLSLNGVTWTPAFHKWGIQGDPKVHESNTI